MDAARAFHYPATPAVAEDVRAELESPETTVEHGRQNIADHQAPDRIAQLRVAASRRAQRRHRRRRALAFVVLVVILIALSLLVIILTGVQLLSR